MSFNKEPDQQVNGASPLYTSPPNEEPQSSPLPKGLSTCPKLRALGQGMEGYYLGTVKAPSSEEARKRIAKLAAFVRENFETKYDPEEARKLALAPSAYRYRKLDEKAVLEYERQLNGLSEPKPGASTTANELRRLRNRRYYEKRKAQLEESKRLKALTPTWDTSAS